MGTVLQERAPQPCVERGSIRDRERRRKAPGAASSRMGRRQAPRKPQQIQVHAQENNDRKAQQRRKHKSHTPTTKRKTCQHSAQGTSEFNSSPQCPPEDRVEPESGAKASQCSGPREQRRTGSRGSKPAFSRHRLSDSSSNLLERRSPKLEVGSLSNQGEGDSDTDLSESERLPVSLSGRVPPQLELRPDAIEEKFCSTRNHRPGGQGRGGFDFPDFLPPPFNSWSLSQLAVLYNMEGLGAARPRPVGTLERYLERLLQLEWHQIQSVQEESGRAAVSDVISSCHRSPAAAASRLSSPKCILQCQRAFPLTFLSSLASHSSLLSGCACTLYRIRHPTCSLSCCRSGHGHARQSRLSPMLERRGALSVPRRSYSESRVHSSDRSTVSQAQRFSSPVRANSHLRRMQASGNIRNPVQGANPKPHSSARDSSVGAERDCFGARRDVIDHRTGGVGKGVVWSRGEEEGSKDWRKDRVVLSTKEQGVREEQPSLRNEK